MMALIFQFLNLQKWISEWYDSSMKKPNKIYRKLGPKTAAGNAFRNAHYAQAPSLRSAFRGVEWVIAGTFSGATLCKLWVQKLMAAMSAMKVPYKGKRLSTLFAMMAGVRRAPLPQPNPELR